MRLPRQSRSVLLFVWGGGRFGPFWAGSVFVVVVCTILFLFRFAFAFRRSRGSFFLFAPRASGLLAGTHIAFFRASSMPRGKRKVQQPASGGGRARRGRKSVVEEEEDSSSEGEDVNEGSVPEEPLTQFTQLSQLEEEDDDSNELWKNGDEFGPMETVRGLTAVFVLV